MKRLLAECLLSNNLLIKGIIIRGWFLNTKAPDHEKVPIVLQCLKMLYRAVAREGFS